MRHLFPKQSFSDRYEFVGALQQGDRLAEGLHIVLQFSLIGGREIVGKVLGDWETAQKLGRVFVSGGSPLKLRSNANDGVAVEIRSDDVRLPSLSVRDWPPYTRKMTYVVSELKLRNVSIVTKLEPREVATRSVLFFLAGPRRMWGTRWSMERSYTGDTKVEISDAVIELNESFPFRLKVAPRFLDESAEGPERLFLTTDVQTLEFETTQPVEVLADEEFVAHAKAVTEDLSLLVSFSSRRWVTWYRYELVTQDKVENYVRIPRECSGKEIDWDDALIDPCKTRDFLRQAHTQLRRLRSEDFDLFMPLEYYLAGIEARYLEEKFAVLFLSLERIKDIFSQTHEGLKAIVAKSVFEKLRKSVSSSVKELDISPDDAKKVLEKIAELNRPSFRSVLDALLLKLGVDWTDLYPSGSELTLIKTRNILFHTSKTVDVDHLSKEQERLQALLERILLSFLGWTDFSRSPNEYTKRWLVSSR